jgi:hypothetical protein
MWISDTYKRMKTIDTSKSLEISSILYVALMVIVFTIATVY